MAWQGPDGAWHYQGELTRADIKSVTVTPEPEPATASRTAFRVRYEGAFPGGVSVIEDRFVLTPDQVQMTTLLPGFAGPVRRVVPLLARDGKTEFRVAVSGDTVTVSLPGHRETGRQTFTAVDAATLTVGDDHYPNHNGWARLAVGAYPPGAGERGITLRISGKA